MFHIAALPGSRDSWGNDFAAYERANVLATQQLLEACRERSLRRFVYSSSSSVYGSAARFPVSESDLPGPVTPYGVTKLAGEHLCRLYASNFGIPAVALRYFSVYGPRQRPDMAIHRIIDAGLSGLQFSVLGDGEQRRDFTFVDDVVDANVHAMESDLEPGTVVNIGTGNPTALNRVIEMVADLIGRGITRRETTPSVPGDPHRTEADVTLAAALLGWKPRTSLDSGIRRPDRRPIPSTEQNSTLIIGWIIGWDLVGARKRVGYAPIGVGVPLVGSAPPPPMTLGGVFEQASPISGWSSPR